MSLGKRANHELLTHPLNPEQDYPWEDERAEDENNLRLEDEERGERSERQDRIDHEPRGLGENN